jgi:pyruvate dehydrogenase E1 component alpha subunit
MKRFCRIAPRNSERKALLRTEAWNDLTQERLLWLYRHLSLIRLFEERLKWLVETGVPVGAVHYYTGQEAVAVGVCATWETTDLIASNHRGHGHCIAKGVDVKKMMAELYGKATGTNRGKGGSMHITDVKAGMLGVNPIVGAGATHAVGAALSAKVRGSHQVAVAFFGEGAAGIGALHEAMTLAAIWKLPVVFVCENNGYAQATPVEYAVPIKNIADRAAGYNMPGAVVDGQDVLEVWDSARTAVNRARGGLGPSFIECKTYRYYGHHQGDDPHRYRTVEEEEAARARDCLQTFRKQVLERGLLAERDLKAVDSENTARIDEAVKFAESSPLPDLEELYTEVYVPNGVA